MLDRLLNWMLNLTVEVPMTVATAEEQAAQEAARAEHRAELKEALRYLCDGAKEMRRKGHIGTASAAYTKQHAIIDARLYELDELEATK